MRRKTKVATGQLEFPDLLIRDSVSPTRDEGFSEGFHYDSQGTFLGLAGVHEQADKDVIEAVSHHDPFLLEVSLLNGAPNNADSLLEGLGAELLPIIRAREKAHLKNQREIEAEEDRVVKRLRRTETYQAFLNEVKRIGFGYRRIPELRTTLQQYFPTTRSLQSTQQVRAYLNKRVLEADKKTGREVETWKVRKLHPEKYRVLLSIPDWDIDTMRTTLEENFSQFTDGRQPLEGYSPEQIRTVYQRFLSCKLKPAQ